MRENLCSFGTKSTQSWDLSVTPHDAYGSSMSGLATMADDRGIHVTWSEGWSSQETYYARLQTDYNLWSDEKNVTDDPNQPDGGGPSIALSTSKVHVGYNPTNYDPPRTRDFQWPQSTWQGILTAGTGPYRSFLQRIAVSNGKLNVLWEGHEPFTDPYGRLKHYSRDLNSTTYTQQTVAYDSCNHGYPLYVAVTSDGKLHVIYTAGQGGYEYTIHRYWNGSSWSSYIASDFAFYQHLASLKSNSNDLYLVYLHPIMYGILMYRQYDAAPVAPQNLQVANYNNNPRLTWNANQETDLAATPYKLYRKIVYIGGGVFQDWIVRATVSGTSYVDTDIGILPKPYNYTIYYKLTASDVVSHESAFSNQVAIDASGLLWKTAQMQGSDQKPSDFALQEAYPNPFNPSTQITYALPNPGFASLVVSDILGREVNRLATGYQEAGYASVTWSGSSSSGSSVASGMYFARLTVTDDVGKVVFAKTIKLLLTR